MPQPSPNAPWAASPVRPIPVRSAADRIAEGREAWRGVSRHAAASVVPGGVGRQSVIILSGWACEARVSASGRRQIFSILLPGDTAFLAAGDDRAAVSVVALTRLELSAGQAAVSAAGGAPLPEALMQQSQRLCDHIVRLGALSASERTVDFLLELHRRLSRLGLVREDAFKVPLTQDVFSEILGLSVVHMNRTLGALKRQGLLSVRGGAVRLHDIETLARHGRGAAAIRAAA